MIVRKMLVGRWMAQSVGCALWQATVPALPRGGPHQLSVATHTPCGSFRLPNSMGRLHEHRLGVFQPTLPMWNTFLDCCFYMRHPTIIFHSKTNNINLKQKAADYVASGGSSRRRAAHGPARGSAGAALLGRCRLPVRACGRALGRAPVASSRRHRLVPVAVGTRAPVTSCPCGHSFIDLEK